MTTHANGASTGTGSPSRVLVTGGSGCTGRRVVHVISGCSLRFSKVYGTGMQEKDSFSPHRMRAPRDGNGVQVHGNGNQARDLVHVDGVVAARVASAARELGCAPTHDLTAGIFTVWPEFSEAEK